ncbi:MAG: MlaD family protein [Planctomycetota bacterium]
MKRDRRSELMAGLFVLVAAAVLLGIALWLGGVSFGGRYVYAVAPLSVGDVGVGDGSPVKFSSIVVGRVEEVRPDEDWSTFLFRIRLEADVIIHRDATIQAVAPALGGVGELYVLDPGSPASPPATREHPATLTVGPNPIVRDVQRQVGFGPEQRDTLQNAVGDAGRALADLAAIAASLRAELTPTGEPNLLADVHATMDGLTVLVETLRRDAALLRRQLDVDHADGAMAKLHHALDAASAAADETEAMMNTIRPDLEVASRSSAEAARRLETYTRTDLAALFDTLDDAGRRLSALLEDFGEITAAARRIVTVNGVQIDEMIANLTETSAHLKAAARDIRRRPWRLLVPPKQADPRVEGIQAAAEAFAEGATQLDDAIARLEALRRAHPEGLDPDDPELQLIRRQIRDAYERFGRLEAALWDEVAE